MKKVTYKEAVELADEATCELKDPGLIGTAFDTILKHILLAENIALPKE